MNGVKSSPFHSMYKVLRMMVDFASMQHKNTKMVLHSPFPTKTADRRAEHSTWMQQHAKFLFTYKKD